MERATLTVEEMGEYLGIGRSAAYAAVAKGEVPSIRIGRRILISRQVLEKFLQGELRPPSSKEN